MINFLINKRILRFVLVSLVFGLLSLIPIYKTLGSLTIGGDTFIPLIPQFSFKLGYQWVDNNNGVYISNLYLILAISLSFIQRLGLTIYQIGFIYQYFIFFISAWGIYKIYNLYNSKNPLYGLIPGTIFIFSPYLVDHLPYYQGTMAIVWITYIFLKFFKLKRFSLVDVVSIALLLGLIADLPNPKYHFLLFLLFLVLLITNLLSKLITINDLKKNVGSFIKIILLASYIWLPYIYFGISFVKSGVIIAVKKGYVNTGEALDYGLATVTKMSRLYHTPNLDLANQLLISNPIFQLFFFLVPVLTLGLFPLIISTYSRRQKKELFILYISTIIFLLLSKSTNPPFGYIYERLLTSSQFFAFLRTSSGIVIFSGVFYSVILGFIFQYFVSKKNLSKAVVFLAICTLIMTGYPLWSNAVFIKHIRNKNTDTIKYGIQIPADYLKTSAILANHRLDSKLLIYPPVENYQQNTWGYFGYIIYPWLYKQPIVGLEINNQSPQIIALTNARYLLYDKSLIRPLVDNPPDQNDALIDSTKSLRIYELNSQKFLPHLYVTNKILYENITNKSSIEEASRLKQIVYPSAVKSILGSMQNYIQPTIEYRKIDPTLYIVNIHGARNIIPLTLSENFHPLWKAYLTKYSNNTKNKKELNIIMNSHYQVFKYNENDQMTSDELKYSIDQGHISTLGNLNLKDNLYFYSNSKKVFSVKKEKYLIDFISKNFDNTIQNDNLPGINFLDRLLLTQQLSASHVRANNTFNSWIFNVEDICLNNHKCIKNSDGTYDFQIVLEYWPQKLTIFAYGVSITSIIFFVLIAVARYLKKKASLS